MRYIFKVLILGNPDVIKFYALRALGENLEEKEAIFEWYKEIRVLDDICDLEIDVLTSFSADLDDLIPMVDGIIYFLNPLIDEESELFEMILPDIFSVKRDIPTIILFYDQNGVIPISVNELLENVWVNYPSLEAFVNLPPKDFHQALQSLGLAMINGDTPLNIENAWMRFPIFIEMANMYFTNKNFYYAAQAIKKAALIAEIYDKEEFFIIYEQAAYLYSKVNLYLEASKILDKFDKIKSRNFKNLYAEAIIREGNLSFNKKKFEQAAREYERAAQWASIESLDRTLIIETFGLAISSWISTCRVEDAFRILDSLPHENILSILKEVSGKIAAAADLLINNNKFKAAKEQLYYAVVRYQREGLSDELKILSLKLNKLLIQYFKQLVNEKNIFDAKNVYDEIQTIWEAYDVEKTDLDSTLEKLITDFVMDNNFGIASDLINKLNSSQTKKKIAKILDEFEDRYKKLKKKELADYINKGIEILREFVEAERDIIVEMNTQIIEEANELSKKKDYRNASNLLRNQSEHLKNIGKEEIRNQILTKSLDILLEGLVFEGFFEVFDDLSDGMKPKYLTRVCSLYIQKIKELKKIDDFKRKKAIIEKSLVLFRKHLLYEESKEISLIFIKIIKKEALKILESEENEDGINKTTDLVNKIIEISKAYLEKEEGSTINFDKIYKKIAEIYIALDDLPSANSYTDRIENMLYRNEIHNRIERLESERSAIASKKAEDTYKGEILKEQLSMIKKKGRESLLDKEKELKVRKSLRKAYFKDALLNIEQQDYNEAINQYKKSIIQLNKSQKYKLAGVSLAMASFFLIKENRFEEIKKLMIQTKMALSSLGRLFSETFPVTLIEYIIELKKFQDESKIKEALSFFDYLPLFKEEFIVLYDYLGKDYREEKESEKTDKKVENIEEIQKMDQILGKIQSRMREIKRDRDDFLKKRKAMRRRDYSDILDHLRKDSKDSKDFKKVAIKYSDLTKTIYKRKDYKTTSFLILMHGLALIKSGESIKIIKNTINEFLNSLGVNKRLIQETFYVMVILFLLDVKLKGLDTFYAAKIKEILEILPVFEEEKVLILSY